MSTNLNCCISSSHQRDSPVFVCSQCGIVRREVNHWFMAWTERSGRSFCFMPLDANPAMINDKHIHALCGQRCLHNAIQKYTDSIPDLRKRLLTEDDRNET